MTDFKSDKMTDLLEDDVLEKISLSLMESSFLALIMMIVMTLIEAMKQI